MVERNKGNMYFFIILVSMVLGSIVMQFIPMNTQYRIVATQWLFLFTPAIIIAKRKGSIKEVLSIKKIDIIDVLIILCISILGIVATGMINIISTAFFHNFLGDAIQEFGKMSLLQWLLVLAVTPAICEEVVLRGVVLSEHKQMSNLKAALMNGFLFGIFHLNINQFLYAFFLGVVMAYMVIITKSILASMLMHFTINGISATLNWVIRNNDFLREQQINAQPNINLSLNMVLGCTIGLVIVSALIFGIMILWSGRRNVELIEPKKSKQSRETKTKVFDIWLVLSILAFAGFIIRVFLKSGMI